MLSKPKTVKEAALEKYSGHPFGREKTIRELITRVFYETECETAQRKKEHHANADAHALAREAYIREIEKRVKRS